MRRSSTPTASRSDQCQERSGGRCEPGKIHQADRVYVSDLCHRQSDHRRTETDDARSMAVSRPTRPRPHAVCLHAILSVMSSVCKTCGAVWAGPSIGRLWHCDSASIRKVNKSAAQPYKVEKIKNNPVRRTLCECGQVAVRSSSCDARSQVCQRCHDCEVGGYGTRLAKGSAGEAYSVRLSGFNASDL